MPPQDVIRVSGAREHNLKDLHLELPRNALVVITGLSGSGKSSLAFDTIYAEGQRRYVESLSAYARQFLGQMDKPDVDSIEGLSPAISIDQKTTSRNPRSTVGTVTEIYDYLRLLWARIGHPHCYNCGRPIAAQSAEQIIDQVMMLPEGTRFMVLAPVVRGRKGEYGKLFEELRAEGFTRVKVDGELRRLEEDIELDKKYKHDIAVVVDRLVMRSDLRKRLADSIETAVGLAEGIVEIEDAETRRGQDLLRALRVPALRHLDARARAADVLVQLAARRVPALHRARLADGDRPRARGAGPEPVARRRGDPAVVHERVELLRPDDAGDRRAVRDRPRHAVGGPGGGRPGLLPVRHERRPDLRLVPQPLRAAALVHDLASRASSRTSSAATRRRTPSTSREKIEEYMSVVPCPDCEGARLRPESLAVKVGGLGIHEVTRMSARHAIGWFEELELSDTERQIARLILREIDERLRFLDNVGVGYLSLERAAATLSGGEAQRIRLATQIGSSLVGVLYILDEPSIGLHQRDNTRLIHTLERLRDLGNTVIVVEHDEGTMRAADHLVDLGPGAGEHGGHLVAEGTPDGGHAQRRSR